MTPAFTQLAECPDQQLPFWLQVIGALGPTATLLAAAIGAAVAWQGIKQQRQIAREQQLAVEKQQLSVQREQWWARFEKQASELLPESSEGRRTIALATLAAMTESPIATVDDKRLVLAFLEQIRTSSGP